MINTLGMIKEKEIYTEITGRADESNGLTRRQPNLSEISPTVQPSPGGRQGGGQVGADESNGGGWTV